MSERRKTRRMTKALRALEQQKYEREQAEKYKRELVESKRLIAWIQRLNKKYGI